MRHAWVICWGILGLCLLWGWGAWGQSVVLDDFESGFDLYDWIMNGWPALTHVTTDGADGTSCSFNIRDREYSMIVNRVFPGVVPADGDYRITFYYKNGHEEAPQDNLQVKINGVGAVSLPNTPVTTWTYAETGLACGLTAGSTVTLGIIGEYTGYLDQQCRFDQFILVREIYTPTPTPTPTRTPNPAGVAPTWRAYG